MNPRKVVDLDRIPLSLDPVVGLGLNLCLSLRLVSYRLCRVQVGTDLDTESGPWTLLFRLYPFGFSRKNYSPRVIVSL